MFDVLGGGTVKDLHLDVYIKVGNARMVGGIAGENGGNIKNCWVSGHVESDHYSQYDADLGGIAGLNASGGKIEYCCVTADVKNTAKNYGVGGIAGSNDGKIEHVTFYGSVSVEHSQDNDYVGDQDGTLNNYYRSFDQGEYDAASGNGLYRKAIKYPYPINITTAGPGSIKFSVEGEENAPGARDGQTVTVTKTSGTLVSFSVKNDNGNSVSVSGNEASGWTFSMPKSKVEIKAVFLNDDGSLPMSSGIRTLEDGKTYKVTENVTLNGRLWVVGTARLILGEGTTLNARRGIEVRSEYKSNLTINGPGTLNITGCFEGDAGIGAKEVGTLTINGGTINVWGGRHAAAIGGSQDNKTGGTITINGGVVNATGGDGAAGIGGGNSTLGWIDNSGVCGDITINGGQVTAKGGRLDLVLEEAPGIGPGDAKLCFNPKNSGTLTLGWTNANDFVYISKFKSDRGSSSLLGENDRNATLESITFVDGKQFVLEGTTTIATADNMAGKKIVPYFTISGAGTEADPYTISNTDDWENFANIVNNGNNLSGKFVKLMADISATQKVGTVSGDTQVNPFSGTFDGNGHTITASITDTGNQGTALFSYINGATIKNLKVAGIINGDIHAAAIVGFSKGTGNSIQNCAATASVNGGSHIGGILGHGIDSDIAITGCVFSGMMTGGDSAKGAIFGWGDDGGNKSITDCLYVMQDGQNTKNLDLVKGGGSVTVTNCYKTTAAEYNESQGQKARSFTRSVDEDFDDIDDIDYTDYYGIWANVYDTKPDYFGELVLDYGFLKVYEGGLEYENEYYVACISLADDADNNMMVYLANEYIVDVTLTGRTFVKDGTWQTICLPFNIGNPEANAYHWFDGTPLEGASVKSLGNAGGSTTGYDATTGTLTLDFVDATSIEAGVPYIVKWERGDDIVDPLFRGVTVSNEDPGYKGTLSADEKVLFIGTYCPVLLIPTPYAILYLGPDNQLHAPESDDITINAFHAGFLVDNGGGVPANIVFNFGVATGITAQPMFNGLSDNSWYSLDGRKLDVKPSVKGVYIINGKKIVIK